MTGYKTNVIKEIRDYLDGHEPACEVALDIIRGYQVSDEFSSGQVKYYNNMGFTPADAKFLTSLSDWKKEGRTFTEKQCDALVRLMPKYARQLFDHFLGKGKIRPAKQKKQYLYNISALFVDFEVPCPETSEVEDIWCDEAEAW